MDDEQLRNVLRQLDASDDDSFGGRINLPGIVHVEIDQRTGMATVEGDNHATRTSAATLKSQAMINLEKWHREGRPMFTKEAIRDIQAQIERCPEEGDMIIVTGLDGAKVAFDVLTRGSGPVPNNRMLEYIAYEPYIDYLTFKGLQQYLPDFEKHSSYCNLRIKHWARIRNALNEKSVLTIRAITAENTDRYWKESKVHWEESETCRQLKAILARNTYLT